MVHSASWLWSLLFPTEELRPWLISAVALLSYQRHPGLCLPVSRSSALLEGASIPPATDASGSSSTWPLSAFLGKLCLLSCGQLYISSGLAPGLEVWNMVFMLILSFFFLHFFLPLLRHAVLLPRNQVEDLVGERFATKSTKEGKQFWICCSYCHELTWDVFCYLGSNSIWVKLPVLLCHKSFCQPVIQTLGIKTGQLNCWVACFGWLGWTVLF